MNELITSKFEENGLHSSAVYSHCKKYRYSLIRKHVKAKKYLLFILLNPSTATELKNDPTIARCQKRTELLGYKAFIICNLFAFRTKSPKIMKDWPKPVGSKNNNIIQKNLIFADKVLCAWGNHGTYLNQADIVVKIIKSMRIPAYHLGLTKSNQPKHPLYITYDQKPIKWF